MPRRGVALSLVVATAGAAASVLALRGGDEEPRGQSPAATETAPGSATIEAPASPGTTEAEAATEPEAVVPPEPEAELEGSGPPAERSLLIGFVDDPSFRWRPYRARMLDAARATGASVVRAMIYWHRLAPLPPVAGEPPFDEPRLFELDELVAETARRNMEVMLTIWGTPAWANGGERPNRPPSDPDDLRDFARALAARYPAVRRYSIWNEPNLEQFLSPQFDAAGQSVAPQLYARLYRAAYEGIKNANPGALVAIGETSARGKDAPSRGDVQDSHSPAGFARLLAEERPRLRFDAWAHHPYPTAPNQPPDQRTRWPAVTLLTLDRFGQALDAWFGRESIPLWITEYGHETQPEEQLGIPRELQAAYAERALALAAAASRVNVFIWFTLRDDPTNTWESGLLDGSGRPKPAYARFSAAVRTLRGER
jgi:hypothetical protein